MTQTTERRKVWDYMVRCGPVSCREIADALDLTTRRVNSHLLAIRKKCDVEVIGSRKAPLYRARGQYKCLGRGNHPNSKANTKTWGEYHRLGLAAMWKKRKLEPRKPEPKIALEECWGWGVAIPARASSEKQDVICTIEGRVISLACRNQND